MGIFSVDAEAGFSVQGAGVISVVHDVPAPVATELSSLADITQSSYRLRRIVGKIFVSLQQLDDPNVQSSVIVTAGLIVLRVGDDALPLDTNLNHYSPQRQDSASDPWIWRRTWMLSNTFRATSPASFFGGAFWPPTNADYGSVADGPHVDQKTARIISAEERLFLVVGTTSFDGTSGFTLDLRVVTDLRVLASLRSNAGNRRNASR